MGHIRSVCTLSELQKLEVINLCDGSRMGTVRDIEFDLCLGNITAILVPKKLCLGDIFQKSCQKLWRIPWCQIERIGDDTILVRFDEVM